MRASDDTREQAVNALRRGLLAGRLGTETFIGRVEAAYHAKTHDQLSALTEDLPRPRRIWGALTAAFASATDRYARTALVPLEPPRMIEGERRILGRDAQCDYSIADPTVSARHAELVRLGDGWLIRDLDSLNGTRVNGWRVKEARIEREDVVAFGAAEFVFRPGRAR